MATARHVPWSLAASGSDATPTFSGLMPPGSILRMAASGMYSPSLDAGPPWPAGQPAVAPLAPALTEERPANNHGVGMLQMHLNDIRSRDPTHVFIARGINRMGPRSQELLASHYSKYGSVVQVVVTRSKVKASRGNGMQTPARPGSLGFIVMDSAGSVARALSAGPEQSVAGCRIRVERFQLMGQAKPQDGGSESSGASSMWLCRGEQPGSSSNDSELPRRSEPPAERAAGQKRGGASTAQDSECSETAAAAVEAAAVAPPLSMPDWGVQQAAAAVAPPLGISPEWCAQQAAAMAQTLGVSPEWGAQQAAAVAPPLGVPPEWGAQQTAAVAPPPGMMPEWTPQEAAAVAPPPGMMPDWTPQEAAEAPAWRQFSPAAAAPSTAPAGGLQSSDLIASVSKVVQIICHTSNLAVFSGQQCVEAIIVSRMAQQQLEVLLRLCEQQLMALSQEASGEKMHEMQDQVQILQDRYTQMCKMIQGAPWWVQGTVPGGPAAAACGAACGGAAGAAAAGAAAASAWAGLRSCGMMPPVHPQSNMAARAAVSASTAAASAAQSALAAAAGQPGWGQSMGARQGPSRAEAEAELPHQAPPQQRGQTQTSSRSPAPPPPAVRQGKGVAAQQAKPEEWPGKAQTLGTHLTQLQEENPRCVFIARKISSMGFQSQEILRLHYARYGQVARVLVVNSKVKPFRSASSQPRIRPGSLGFVVMCDAASVEKILAEGKEQTVAGCHICVEPFEHTVKPLQTRTVPTTDSTSTSTGDTPGSGSRSGSNGSEQGSGSSGSGFNGSEKGSEGSAKSGKSSREQVSLGENGLNENSLREKDINSAEGGSTDSQLAEAESSESGSGSEHNTYNGEPAEQAGTQ